MSTPPSASPWVGLVLCLTVACLSTSARAATDSACPKRTPAQWRTEVEDALRQAVEEYDHPLALARLQVLKQELICVTAPVDQPELGKLFLYEGFILAAMGEAGGDSAERYPERARDAFEGGIALFPQLAWDRGRLGPVGEQLFKEAREAVLGETPTGTLVVPPSGPSLSVWVDGQKQGEGWNLEIPVRTRQHVVSIVMASQRGAPQTQWVEVSPGARLVIEAPEAPVVPSGPRPQAASEKRVAPLLVAAGIAAGMGLGLMLGATAEAEKAYSSQTRAEYDRHRDANNVLFIASLASLGGGAIFLGCGLAEGVRARLAIAVSRTGGFASLTLLLP